MKLIIRTVYNNVDDEWLRWWLERNGATYGIDAASPQFPAEARIADETSNVVALATIDLDAPEIIAGLPEEKPNLKKWLAEKYAERLAKEMEERAENARQDFEESKNEPK